MKKKAKNCESCLMPFSKDPNQRESESHCSFCFINGTFTYTGTDVKEFQKQTYEAMKANGMPTWKAKLCTWMIQFAPRWKKK